jgi:NitT/TauT family transport system ATP-binding protein
LAEIEARGVRMVYGDLVAIDGLDLYAGTGEFVSIVGPSGCGKSTLLYILGDFVEPSGGSVAVDGKLGIVFQEPALFAWKTVLGNIGYGLPRRERARAGEYVELVKLGGFERAYPKELSGGMKQRVALARSLIMDPDVLLMDEPFAAVDAQTRSGLQRELLQIWERSKMTVLFVTHSVDEALLLSDRVYVLSARPARVKEVLEVGLPRPRDREQVLAHPAYPELHARIWSLLEA